VLQTKQCLWYRPVNLPSAEEIDLPLIGSLHPLQFPFDEAGRRSELLREYSGLDGLSGAGDKRPCWIAGSIGDSGANIMFFKIGGGANGLANCSLLFVGDTFKAGPPDWRFLGGDRGRAFSFCGDMDKVVSRSAIKLSTGLTSSISPLIDRGGLRGGLERELAWLASLNPEVSEDCESVGV
jgi:hypothetical protein